MGSTCLTCSHPKRLEIDRRLVQGHGYAALGREFNLPMMSIRYHAQNHLSRQIAVTYARREVMESAELMQKLHEMIQNGQEIFNRNFENGRDATALKAIDSMRLVWELICKIYAHVAEVRRLEQEAERASIESRIEEENAEFLQEAMQRLNYAELEMLQKLLAKANGEIDEVIIRDQGSPFVNIKPDFENAEFDRENQTKPKMRRTK
jgi:hypothetical protein